MDRTTAVLTEGYMPKSSAFTISTRASGGNPSNSLDSKSGASLGAIENTELVAFGVGQDVPLDLLITSPQQLRAKRQ